MYKTPNMCKMKSFSLIIFYCLLTVSNPAFGEDYLTLEQLSSTIEEYNSNTDKQKIVSFHTYRSFHHDIKRTISIERYQARYGITREEFVKTVFGNMKHLTPDQLSKAIEEYNDDQIKQEELWIRERISKGTMAYFIKVQRVHSIDAYRNFHHRVEGALALETYQILYGISEEEFVKKVFGNMKHLTPDQLPRVIEKTTDTFSIKSMRKRDQDTSDPIDQYNRHHTDYYSTSNPQAFSFEIYQILYGITEEEFVETAIGGIRPLTLDQLPKAIEEHNEEKYRSKHPYVITSLDSYSLDPYRRHYSQITGLALPFGDYQVLYGITEEEFVKKVFGNMKHLTPDQLPQAIDEYNKRAIKIRIGTIISLDSYIKEHHSIEGAFAPETYQILYGITEEEFVELVSRSTRTGRSTAGSLSRKAPETNNKVENLTLDQLPTAIEEHNKKRYGQITSFERYQKHHHYIEGALSFKDYQTLHEITEEEFVKQVFGNMEHLTPSELTDAIRAFTESKVHKSLGIVSYSTYRGRFTQIPGALNIETYQILYGISYLDFFSVISGGCKKSFTKI